MECHNLEIDHEVTDELERVLSEHCFCDFVIGRNSTLTLLKDLEAPTEDVSSESNIILSKGRISKECATPLTKAPRPTKRSARSNDLDLTGSPLKCSFSLEDNFDDSLSVGDGLTPRAEKRSVVYRPLSSSEARAAVSRYNVETSRMAKAGSSAFPSCWAICDGADGSLFIGSRRDAKTLTLTSVSCTGPHEQKHEAMSLGVIKKLHAQAAPDGTKVQRNCTARAVFNLSGSDNFVTGIENGASCLEVHATWPDCRSLLEKPSLDAVIALKAAVRPGDSRISSFRMWEELCFLRSFLGGLDNEGIGWRQAGDDEPSLEEDLSDLLETIKAEGPRARARSRHATPDQSTAAEKSDENLDAVLFAVRSDVDFIDMLWSVLHRATSYAELRTAFAHVFALIREEKLRPYIYHNSSTRLAQIIQRMLRDSSAEEVDLTGRLPLEMLVEIGIQKLKRDYLHILQSNYLTTKEDLSPFLSSDVSGNTRSFESIVKLHFVLDLVILMQTYLSPDKDCLRSIVQKAFKELKGSSIDNQNCKEFVFNIPMAYVKEQLTKCVPNLWQCQIVSQGDSKTVETVGQLRIDLPLNIENPPKDARDPNSDALLYYFITKTSIKRIL